MVDGVPMQQRSNRAGLLARAFRIRTGRLRSLRRAKRRHIAASRAREDSITGPRDRRCRSGENEDGTRESDSVASWNNESRRPLGTIRQEEKTGCAGHCTMAGGDEGIAEGTALGPLGTGQTFLAMLAAAAWVVAEDFATGGFSEGNLERLPVVRAIGRGRCSSTRPTRRRTRSGIWHSGLRVHYSMCEECPMAATAAACVADASSRPD